MYTLNKEQTGFVSGGFYCMCECNDGSKTAIFPVNNYDTCGKANCCPNGYNKFHLLSDTPHKHKKYVILKSGICINPGGGTVTIMPYVK